MITFTTTATYRPELLKRTFESFSKNITDVNFSDCTLIINFDPLPIKNLKSKDELIKICNDFFGNVIFNFPKNPSFPLALKRIWENTETEFVFNLEDDWILNEPIKIEDLKNLMKSNPNSIGVNLNAYLFNVDKFRIRLSPGLFKGDWVREASTFLTHEMCPEQQLRRKLTKELKAPLLNYPPYENRTKGKTIVKDIGRTWRNEKGISRGGHNFVTWM